VSDEHPVFDRYFADPFVFRAGPDYYALGTGAAEAHAEAGSMLGATGVFPLLQSRDLLSWREIGHALKPPPSTHGDSFWAPEVACADGRWFLYYSVGHGDAHHQLRVAVSDSPAGPYADVGALTDLTQVPFAIDPHPFRDRDGKWYLFHARDFIDLADDGSRRAGTALVVHELETMTRLASAGRTVLRARRDWQRFMANRTMYGQTFDWHTLEGPCVVMHREQYYCLYSGGCWQTDTYGVDYAIASHPLGPYEDTGSEDGPRILRTEPARVIGPGHCSVVRAPDGERLVLVYHAWDAGMTARTMRIAELFFGPDGPRARPYLSRAL